MFLTQGLEHLFLIKTKVSYIFIFSNTDFVMQTLRTWRLIQPDNMNLDYKGYFTSLAPKLFCSYYSCYSRVNRSVSHYFLLTTWNGQDCIFRWNTSNWSNMLPEFCCSEGIQCRTAKLPFKFLFGWIPQPLKLPSISCHNLLVSCNTLVIVHSSKVWTLSSR